MPTTIGELITATEVELEQAQKRYARANETIKTILAKAKHEGRANVTQDEDSEIESCHTARQQAKVDIEGVQHKLAELRRTEAEEREYEALMTQRRADPVTASAGKPAYDQVARVSSEERTYHRGNSGQGGLFLKDVMRQYMFRDMDAEVRLQRHMQEERVERGKYMQERAGTGSFTGLTVPQYLTDMYAPLIRALRPFADICNKHDLPEQGMTINISRITTGTSVGIQTTQNAGTGIGNTDPSDTLLTENVQTAAGTVTLSRQAIERGTGIEDVTMSDLQRAYATNLDSTLLNQATTGLTNVAGTSATYATTTPTVASFYPQILAAMAASETNLLAQAAPNYAIMHPRRWYWMSNALVNVWPLVNQQGFPAQSAAQAHPDSAYNRGIRGILPMGLQVIGDANVAINLGAGTNQDEVYIVAADECHLWEDPNAPQFIRAEQPAAGTLGVQLVLYGYFAYTFRRYTNGQQKIAGTGLVTPTFTGS